MIVFLKAAWAVAKLIPWQVYAVVVAAIWVYGYGVHEHTLGYNEAKGEDAKAQAEQMAFYQKRVAEIQAKQQEVIIKTVTVYRDRIKIVKEKGDEVIREIPVIVGDAPVLSGGVRVAHDAAALGHLPDDPEGAARAAAPVETTTLLRTVAENYESCEATRQQLISLQSLVSTLGEKQ